MLLITMLLRYKNVKFIHILIYIYEYIHLYIILYIIKF